MNNKFTLLIVCVLVTAVAFFVFARGGEKDSATNDGDSNNQAVNPLLDYYPEGKKVRSLGVFHVTGKGKNQKWIFQTDCHFAYEYKILLETFIVSNDGEHVVTEILVKSADEMLLDSEREFAWRSLEDPLLEMLWNFTDTKIGRLVPYYDLVSDVAHKIPDVVNKVPKEYAEIGDSWIKSYLGIESFPDDAPPEVIARFKNSMGYKFRIKFDSEFNVVGTPEIIEKGPGELSYDAVKHFAHSGNLLFDHVLGPAVHKGIDASTRLDASKLSRLIASDYDVASEGFIMVSRSADEDGLKRLEVDGGQVRIRASTDSGEQTGTVTPSSGMIKFSEDGLFVSNARLSWEGEASWFDENHLLFGTTAMRNISVKSFYEAALVTE